MMNVRGWPFMEGSHAVKHQARAAGSEFCLAVTVASEGSRSPHSWLVEVWSDRISGCHYSITQLIQSSVSKESRIYVFAMRRDVRG